MPATATALIEQVFGSTLQNAYLQPGGNGNGAQNLDLIQIVVPGSLAYDGSISVALNVDFAGTVHNPPVSPTNGARLGVFFSNLTTAATTAQLFASAFANPSNLDILQCINAGGNISYFLSYLGVATGS